MSIEISSPSVIEFRYKDPQSSVGITKLKIESHTINDEGCYIKLGEHPYEAQGIQIVGDSSMTPVDNADEVTTNTYFVDYGSDMVVFDKSKKGQTYQISYYSCGCDLLSASRVFTFLGDTDTPTTLQKIIDDGEKFIELQTTYDSADDLIQTLIQTKNDCVKELDDKTTACKNDLEIKTVNCEGRVDSKITSANDVLTRCTEVNTKMEENLADLNKYRSGILADAQANATDLINDGMGGYVIKTKEEILIVDKLKADGTLDKDDKTVKIWRWNKNGLGYSSTGYNGTFTMAMTKDGAICADFITTGTMSANLLKGGVLKSVSGNGTKLDLTNGSFELHNTQNSKVMSVNADGNLETNTLAVTGDGDNNILFSGNGAKSMILESTNYGDLFLYFKRIDKTNPTNISTGRIGVYSGDDIDRSSQIFIEPGSLAKGAGKVIMRGSNSTVSQNEFIDCQIYGTLYVASTITSANGDYAELFEWNDGNLNNEDRIGYIVTLNNGKIDKANGEDDVLGIISATATVIGDSAETEWKDKYLKDDFGRVQKDKEGNSIINPLWDKNKEYIPRKDRKEWDVVGLNGKLYVRDNGKCEINDYIKAENGIAIPSDKRTNIKMLERVSKNVIRVYKN